jgi:hypothetical protein
LFKALIFVLAIGVSASTATIEAGATEPYDLRGIKLGMLLSEFRKTPHPDGIRATVICQGDPEARSLYTLSAYGDEATAGVIVCNFYEWGGMRYRILREVLPGSTSPPTWEEAALNVATIGVYMEYKFIPDPTRADEPALYSIVVRSNVGYWYKFWEAYTAKYGKPTNVSEAPVQNKAGATFDNVEAVWDNGVSTITLIKRFERIDNTYVFYEHRRLASEIKRRVEQKEGKPSDKL